jgi:hypothetical protein
MLLNVFRIIGPPLSMTLSRLNETCNDFVIEIITMFEKDIDDRTDLRQQNLKTEGMHRI